MKKKIQGVYAITHPDLFAGITAIEAIIQALEAGVRVLQYRDKHANSMQRQQRARQLQQLCQAHQVVFIVNDDWQLALEIGADGVHLGKKDGDLTEVRARAPSNFIIGVSCYNQLSRALMAQQNGADYVAFGRFFPSNTKPDAVACELGLLTQAKARLQIPVVAIGGINAQNARQVIQAGADGIAVIEAVFGTDGRCDIYQATRELVNVFIKNYALDITI